MADNNLTSSISALITQIKSEIPNANAENLKRLARSVRKLGHSGDNEIDTLINSRANALTATATTEELQTIAEAINQVDDTSNPTGATNTNADVHVSDTAPASAVSGDLWWKTDDLNLYIYYEDTDGAQWIQANSTVVAGAVPSDISDLTDTTNLLLTQSDIDTSVANVVDSAPETLNTLNELAAALGDDPNFATTITNQIASAGGSKVDIVATGTIADGNPVVLRSDGTVEVITASTTLSTGSTTTFQSSVVQTAVTHYDPVSQKIAVAWRQGGVNQTYAKIGTVSGTSISFGAAATISSNNTTPMFIQHVTENTYLGTFGNRPRLVFGYIDHGLSNRPYVHVMEVSGTGLISRQSNYRIYNSSAQSDYMKAAYDDDVGTMVVFHAVSSGEDVRATIMRLNSSGVYSSSNIGDMIGNSLGYNSNWDHFVSAAVYDKSSGYMLAFYPQNRSGDKLYVSTLLCDKNGLESYTLNDMIELITSDDTDLFYNHLDTEGGKQIAAVYVPTIQKTVVFYPSGFDPRYIGGFIVSCDSSGNITKSSHFTSNLRIKPDGDWNISASYNSTDDNITLMFSNEDDSQKPHTAIVTCTSTSLAFSASERIASPKSIFVEVMHDANSGNDAFIVQDESTDYGQAIVGSMAETTNLTAQNFLGISNGAYTNGQTATIQTIGSVDDAQSGLTPGTEYYVQSNGTLATGAGNPSVKAGLAISATKLLIRN